MKYNEKYDRYVDDDLVIYRWSKTLDKLVQCKLSKDIGGYLRTRTRLGNRSVHRIIWETFNGEIPNGFEIDHINTIRTDYRLENLRCVTKKENCNNPLTLKHKREAMIGKQFNKGKQRTEFSKEFKNHYGISPMENVKFYDRVRKHFKKYGTWKDDNATGH